MMPIHNFLSQKYTHFDLKLSYFWVFRVYNIVLVLPLILLSHCFVFYMSNTLHDFDVCCMWNNTYIIEEERNALKRRLSL